MADNKLTSLMGSYEDLEKINPLGSSRDVVELARKKLLALFQDTYEFDTQDSSTVDSLIEKIDSVVENKKELIEKINTDPRKEYWNQKIIGKLESQKDVLKTILYYETTIKDFSDIPTFDMNNLVQDLKSHITLNISQQEILPKVIANGLVVSPSNYGILFDESKSVMLLSDSRTKQSIAEIRMNNREYTVSPINGQTLPDCTITLPLVYKIPNFDVSSLLGYFDKNTSSIQALTIRHEKKLQLGTGTPAEVDDGYEVEAEDEPDEADELDELDELDDEDVDDLVVPWDPEHVRGELLDVFAMKAHLMDKESFVRKRTEQDVMEESARRFAGAGMVRKLGMFLGNRVRQQWTIGSRLKQHQGQTIESDALLQARISGSIGTFAEQHAMGLDWDRVEMQSLGHDNVIDGIAHDYLLRIITRQQAIDRINQAIGADQSLQIAAMTGTDIMDQLDAQGSDYALFHIVSPYVSGAVDYIRVRLALQAHATRLPHFSSRYIADIQCISDTEIDALIDEVKYMVHTQGLEDANLGTLRRIEVNLVGLTRDGGPELAGNEMYQGKGFWDRFGQTFGLSSQVVSVMQGLVPGNVLAFGGSWLTRLGVGAAIVGSGGGALLAAGGVIAVSSLLQGLKTYKNFLQEAAKTHEDALAMGVDELADRIRELETASDSAGGFNKFVGNFLGFGSYQKQMKQLAILRSVEEGLRADGVMRSADAILNGLKTRHLATNNIADVLARLNMGHELGTHFIHSTSRDRVEIDRLRVMRGLRQAIDECHINNIGPIPHPNAGHEIWQSFWDRLVAHPLFAALYDDACQRLRGAHQKMTDDVRDGRRRSAVKDFGKSFVRMSAIGGITLGISHGIDGIFGGGDGIVAGPERTYELGGHDKAHEISSDDGSLSQLKGHGVSDSDIVTVRGESAVDGVRAIVGKYTQESMLAQRYDVLTALQSMASNPVTDNAFENALSDDAWHTIQQIGQAAGADEGNQRLVFLRWIDGMKELGEYMQTHGMSDLQIDEIKFDPTAFKFSIQESILGATPADSMRKFACLIEVSKAGGEAGSFPWWITLPSAINTYSHVKEREELQGTGVDQASGPVVNPFGYADDESFGSPRRSVVVPPVSTPTPLGRPLGPVWSPQFHPVIKRKDEYFKKKWKEHPNPFEDDILKPILPEPEKGDEKDVVWGVTARGGKGSVIDGDAKPYFDQAYPGAYQHRSIEEIAHLIIHDGRYAQIPFYHDVENYPLLAQLTGQIQHAISQRNFTKAEKLLVQVIQGEHRYIAKQSYGTLIDDVLGDVDKFFEDNQILDVNGNKKMDRASIPDKDKIHIVPAYEFWGHAGQYEENTLGFCFIMNGEIYINHDVLVHGPDGERSSNDAQILLRHVIQHEIIHATSTSNYRKKVTTTKKKILGKNETSSTYPNYRRIGFQMNKRLKNGKFIERGRALNEAITEDMNISMLKGNVHSADYLVSYPHERYVLEEVSDTFNIDKKLFYQMLISRKGSIEKVARQLDIGYFGAKETIPSNGSTELDYGRSNKPKGENIPLFLTVLVALMDYEFDTKKKNVPYGLCHKLIDKKQITLPPKALQYLPALMVDKDGTLKKIVSDAYKITVK